MKRKDNKMQEWTKYKNMYKKKSKDKKKWLKIDKNGQKKNKENIKNRIKMK